MLSNRRTAACTAAATSSGFPPAVRTSRKPAPDGFCATGSKICGTGSRLQALTPHVVDDADDGEPGAGGVGPGPRLRRRPTASSPGQRRRASASLTMATRGDAGPSRSEKNRPPRRRVPNAWNRPSLISSLRYCRREDTASPSSSVVRVRSELPPMNASLMKPARSTPGSDSIPSSARR